MNTPRYDASATEARHQRLRQDGRTSSAPTDPQVTLVRTSDVNIDLLEEPDGRYRLTARIAGVTYLSDRFGIRGDGLRIDYTELLSHAAAVVLTACPTPESPEIEYDIRTPAERGHQAGAEPVTPGLELPSWMIEDALVRVTDEVTEADHGWIKGFLDTPDPTTVPSVVVYRQSDGPGLYHPAHLTLVPDPAAELRTWMNDEKRRLREDSWRRLRQRASGLRVYRLDQERDEFVASLVPRAELAEPQIVDIDLETGPADDRSDYRDVSEQHRLTLQTPDGPRHDDTFDRANQIHTHATALLLAAYPNPELPLPGWRLRTDEDRLLVENRTENRFRPLPPGLIVRTPEMAAQRADFGRVDHLMTPDLVVVIRVGQGPGLFTPGQLERYTPTGAERAALEALDQQIRKDVRARAERETAPGPWPVPPSLTAPASRPDLG